MDGASLNAIGIIALAVVAVAAPMCGGRPDLSWSRLAGSAGVAAGIALVGLLFGLHKCDVGNPLWQWIVGAAAAASVVVFVKKPSLRSAGASAVVLLSIALCAQMLWLIHSSSFTGTGPDLRVRMYATYLKPDIDAMIDSGWWKEDDREVPAGWLHEAPSHLALFASGSSGLLGPKAETFDLWHTWFTGIRGLDVERRGIGVWYPGGKLRDGIPRIEIRDLPPDVIARLPPAEDARR